MISTGMPQSPPDLEGEWAFRRNRHNDVRVVALFLSREHRKRWLERQGRVLGYAITINGATVYCGDLGDFHPDVHGIYNLGKWRGAHGLAGALVAEARSRGYRASTSTWEGAYRPYPEGSPGDLFEMLARYVQVSDPEQSLDAAYKHYLKNMRAKYVVKIGRDGRSRRISW